jgi:anaerobic selenocysteine-containing dehydrogenase
MPLVVWPKDAKGEVYTLLPIFRLPHLIHTRSGNSKFLYEIAHKNPLWVNPADAAKLGGIRTGDLLKVHTEIGFFVLHAWVTEGLAPGVVACSHHMGRWRLNKEDQVERMSSAWVALQEVGKGTMEDAPDFGSGAIRDHRSRYEAGVVERRGGAPESHVPGASRSNHRHALLAPDGAGGASRRR